MDFRFTAEENAFRERVRQFLAKEIPEEIRAKVRAGVPLSKEDMVTSHRILNKAGYAVPHWPKEWGGSNFSAVERYILLEEIQMAAVPPPLSANASMIGPVLAAFGSETQKRQFLPRIANLDDWWCQGFSEPESGSDLASLKLPARKVGDRYVLNGQKIWTTYAQHADWMFCLVRTDFEAKPQRGISFLLVDMRSPGITQRPIILVDGDHEVNEVFFDNVEVPVENLVGEENRGWDYAKYLLAHERTGIAGIGVAKELVARIRNLAKATKLTSSASVWNDQGFRIRLAEIEVDLAALETTQLRVAAAQRVDESLDAAASLLKIRGSELQQAATALLLELAGGAGVVEPGEGELDWRHHAAGVYLNWRKLSIYGGSNEIQRVIIAKSLFG